MRQNQTVAGSRSGGNEAERESTHTLQKYSMLGAGGGVDDGEEEKSKGTLYVF